MKLKKFTPLFRGLAATSAALLALSSVAYTVAMSNIAIGWMDGWFQVDRNIYETTYENVPGYTIPGGTEGYTYLKGVNYQTTYASADAYAAALKQQAIKQGEEGFALCRSGIQVPVKVSETVYDIAD